jgi:hypothetical protein
MVSKALALVSMTIFGGALAAVGCSSSSTGTGSGDDTTQDSGPAVDAKADHSTTTDAAQTFDTGSSPDTSTAATCEVVPLPDGGMFPPIAAQAAMTPCQTGDLTAFANDCFGASGSAAACGNWIMGSGTGTAEQQECGACINGNNTNMTYGVLVPVGEGEGALDEVSSFGCVFANDTSTAGTACANALWNLYVCENTACAGCTYDPSTMMGTDNDMGTMLSACNMNAESGECSSYVNTANTDCQNVLTDGGATVCDQSQYMGDGATDSAFFQTFFTIGHTMCGGS